MSAGTLVSVLTYLPKSFRDYVVPPMSIPDVKNDASKVQLKRISHVYYQHPDLDKYAGFATDFGFVEAHRAGNTVYYRGYGKDQYVYVVTKGRVGFKGAAFVAASKADFDKALQLPGAVLHSLDNLPGGGQQITITRPNGTCFHVLYGQEERIIDSSQLPSGTHETQGSFNSPFEKQRFGNYALQASMVLVANFKTQAPFSAITKARLLCTNSAISATPAESSRPNSTSTRQTSTSCTATCSTTQC